MPAEVAQELALIEDINTSKGLKFDGGQLEINPGANISFDADGKIQTDIDALSYKGALDLTADAVPAI